MAITEYIRNVDRAVLNTVFENTVRRVNKCLETGGGHFEHYRGADKSLARLPSRCILFDGENISFDASLVTYIYILLIFLQL